MIEWSTPSNLFQELNREFNFNTDVCASDSNTKCFNYFTDKQNSINIPWVGVCWMNPPYGRSVGLWVRKAYLESCLGATVVCLLPSSTDTKWWHDYVMKAAEIRFIKNRLYFNIGDRIGRCPFPSVIVVFDGKDHRPIIRSIGPYKK